MTKMPECLRDDCRFIDCGGTSTLAYYAPIYNKNGVNVNPDRNIATSVLECLTCGKRWSCVSGLDETVYTEVK